MMELPDELTLSILSHTLKVPDEFFINQGNTPASASPSAQCLAVCRLWLGIGTPLLYHTVILPSASHAEALALTLRGNKRLGRFIKQLRIEGGYGSVMYNIIKAAPNVTDIYLPLHVSSSDNTSGLCRALPMMKPIRVILSGQTHPGLDNKQAQALHKTLNECIKEWKSMKTLYFPYSEAMELHAMSTLVDELAEAIKVAPALQKIHMPFGYSFPKHLLVMAQNPSLCGIFVQRKHTHSGTKFSFEYGVQDDPRLNQLVVFLDPVI